jgi:uncharacterized protein (TIGR03435 family)
VKLCTRSHLPQIVAFVMIGTSLAQTAPRFEVASVKTAPSAAPGSQGGGGESIVAHPGSLTMKRVRLRACLKWAFDLKEYQIAGPGWMGSPGWLGADVARYEIVARAAEGTPVSEMRVMLQTLLAERFKLVAHRETKEVPAFRLTLVKMGSEMHKVADAEGESAMSVEAGVFVMRKTSMTEFANFISGPMGAPVVDATNLPGRFDLSINEAPFMPASGATREDSQYAFVKAIEQQLGLKLEKRPAPIEMLIVDRAEKVPVEN